MAQQHDPQAAQAAITIRELTTDLARVVAAEGGGGGGSGGSGGGGTAVDSLALARVLAKFLLALQQEPSRSAVDR